MNPRILVAFAAGAMAASGILFVAMRPGSHSYADSTPVAVRTPKKAVAAVPIPPPPPPSGLPDVSSAGDLVQVQAHEVRAEVHSPKKPSPMPVGVKKWPADKPVAVVAQNAPPPAPADAGPQMAAPPQATMPEGSMPVERSNVPLAQTQPEPQEQQAAAPPVQEPPRVTIRPGTLISVRLGQSLSTQRNQPGDSFFANLDEPLVIDGWIIAARGSRAEGRVIDCGQAGRIQGGGELGLQLTAINTTDGQHIGIATATFLKRGASWSGSDAAKVGGAAALGAAIGAIAGGGKGAGIGAVIGSAAGAGGVIYARRSGADVPVETRISFRVDRPVRITEKLD